MTGFINDFYSKECTEQRLADSLRFGGREYPQPFRAIATIAKSIFSLPFNAVALGIHFFGLFTFKKNAALSFVYTIQNIALSLLNILTLGNGSYFLGEKVINKNGLKSVLLSFEGIVDANDDYTDNKLPAGSSGYSYTGWRDKDYRVQSCVEELRFVGEHLFKMSDEDIDAVGLEHQEIVGVANPRLTKSITLFKALKAERSQYNVFCCAIDYI